MLARPRVRIHNEKMSVAPRRTAEGKRWAQRSWRVAMRRQSLDLANRFSTSNPYVRFWKIPQQEVSIGQASALPFPEQKADRSSFRSHTTGRLLVRTPVVRPIKRGSATPF
ncbi:hypothetical protein FLM9_858 [Candidatus Synechococcus spongiarum]|uniref:Uncharacterized protein n=1 Tax=Candidatus Synechococcus spongiarum TaxID=431041 RepID=A0A170TBG5_9SYNE|nr:hypothetical protein FLM9_858 [Candidatus Synechococcus spongiarum]